MSEGLFSGTGAEGETYLCVQLGHDRAAERLKVHRDEFITERDFEDIAVKGFNAVRIPVPFFLFEDVGPYIHCCEYLDKAFDWAEKFGLKILVDLELAKNNTNYTLEFLRQFYRDSYAAIRRHMGPEKYVVFADAFELDIWDDFLKQFEGVVLDTHNYLMGADMVLFRERNVKIYAAHLKHLGERVNAAAKRVPLIVGEWNIQNQADGLAAMTQAEKDDLYTTVAQGFQESMKDTLGWFYWTYKVMMGGLDAECDDAMCCVNHGWLTLK